ncbi:hypothetical protein [Micromonospora coerulea]|uniref:hypothetical protein n=1 Tax=Micromonospora coerulea TaxID=47856 RepID=UPI0019088202|nr:hypothetical protein [Micromonospora veneta]
MPSLPAGSSRTSNTSTSDDAGSTASSGNPTVEPLKNAPRTPGSHRACSRTHSTATARARPTRIRHIVPPPPALRRHPPVN